MTGKSDLQLNDRVNIVFDHVVGPAFEDLIGFYDGAGGYVVKVVPDGPLITGMKRYSSIMVRHPGGLEMIVCVYWVQGSERLVAENIRMVTLSRTSDIYSVTREGLLEQLKFLSGLQR